ncbi:hypothetical protein C4580_01205 [Candidatus Woesearchaeota archaeon]|nr:MAG: hypothetical protein C4580_01205 [Candidatus Woesearchaeota archaeon]
MSDETVMFYFWHHGARLGEPHFRVNIAELRTPQFEQLAARADVLFEELVMERERDADEFEELMNRSFKGERIKNDALPIYYDEEKQEYLSRVFQGKKYVVERTFAPQRDLLAMQNADRITYLRLIAGPIDDALRARETVLRIDARVQAEREERVARQIGAVPGRVLVLFGGGHRELAGIVGKKRPIEVYAPFEGTAETYETLLRRKLREGVFDADLCLRSAVELIVDGAAGLDGLKRKQVAHAYAGALESAQLRDFLEYANRVAAMGLSARDIVSSYIKSRNVPLAKDVREMLTSQ